MDSEDSDDETPSIVLDIGETHCKLGYGADKTCRYKFPTLIATDETGSLLYGDAAEKGTDLSTLRCPISRGRIQDLEYMDEFLSFCFRQMPGLNMREQNMLVTTSQASGRSHYEHLAQYMLESHDVKGFYMANPCVLALAESGRNTGVGVDCGEGSTSVLPMIDGYVFQDGLRTQNLAGFDVSSQLRHLLREKGTHFSTFGELLHVRKLKERFCFTSSCSDEYLSNMLPEIKAKLKVRIQNMKTKSETMSLESERIEAPEVLFQPRLRIDSGERVVSLPRLVYDSIMECSAPEKQHLFSNIVIAGSTSFMPGFTQRFQSELAALAGKDFLVKVMAPPERNKSVWLGGSILSALPCMDQLWITRFDYAEYGPGIVHRIAF